MTSVSPTAGTLAVHQQQQQQQQKHHHHHHYHHHAIGNSAAGSATGTLERPHKHLTMQTPAGILTQSAQASVLGSTGGGTSTLKKRVQIQEIPV